MAAQRQPPNQGADETQAPPPTTSAPEVTEHVRRLGEALKARADDVLERTVARTIGSGEVVDALVQESFERICASSTDAVARWIAGEGLEEAREAGWEAWQIFGELAARRAASLKEVTRRCLCWRDVAADVLRESAAHRGAWPEALAEALTMLQLSLEFSLVRMCEC